MGLFNHQIDFSGFKTNMSPENQWLADAFPIKPVPFKGTLIKCSGV